MNTSPYPLTHSQLLQLKRWNTPTIYNGWEQITSQDPSKDSFNLEETRDFMPHIHEPAPGVTVAVGCNGRGIALCTSFGKHIASRLTSQADEFPYPISPITPIPMHQLQRFYIAAGVAWYSLLDRFG